MHRPCQWAWSRRPASLPSCLPAAEYLLPGLALHLGVKARTPGSVYKNARRLRATCLGNGWQKTRVLQQEERGVGNPALLPKEMCASCFPGKMLNILTIFYHSILTSHYPRGSLS